MASHIEMPGIGEVLAFASTRFGEVANETTLLTEEIIGHDAIDDPVVAMALHNSRLLGVAAAYEEFTNHMTRVLDTGDAELYTDEQLKQIYAVSLDFTFMTCTQQVTETILDADMANPRSVYGKHERGIGFMTLQAVSGIVRALNEIAKECHLEVIGYDGVPLGWK